MKVSANEAKLTGFWATKNCATIQLGLISKSAFGPEKLPGLSRNGPLAFEYRSEAGDDHKERYYLYENFDEKFSSNATGLFLAPKQERNWVLPFTKYR